MPTTLDVFQQAAVMADKIEEITKRCVRVRPRGMRASAACTRAHTHLAHAHGRLQLLGVALGARVGNKRLAKMRINLSEKCENDNSDSEDDSELVSETGAPSTTTTRPPPDHST